METRIGSVTHYYGRIQVAVLELNGELDVGDTIHVLGHNTDFTQQVASLEIEYNKVQSVGPGEEVALKVVERVRTGDDVFKVVECVSISRRFNSDIGTNFHGER